MARTERARCMCPRRLRGVSKVVLTACLARGMDAVIGGVPASLLARLRLTCPESWLPSLICDGSHSLPAEAGSHYERVCFRP
jgi:hypothetical protein